MRRWLTSVWYEDARGGSLLVPFGALFELGVALRRHCYRIGLPPARRIGVPVIVVGNITVGGTGKTPLVQWLVRRLAERGWKPGIVSRGYGGRPGPHPLRVAADSDPARVGDEPLVLARSTPCPIFVHPDRVAAARSAKEAGADVIVADDGLQYYRLARDVEIAVVDTDRGLGNRRCLPAGPLREPPARFAEVDYIFTQGLGVVDEAIGFMLMPDGAVNLGDGTKRRLEEFAGHAAYAIAGIGNPARFFRGLRDEGIKLIEHPLADHAKPTDKELNPPDRLPVFMTEKDAVKCEGRVNRRHWYVPVSVRIDAAEASRFLEALEARIA